MNGHYLRGREFLGFIPHEGGIFMLIIGLLLAAALIYFIVRKERTGSAGTTPLDLLKNRFVNGEISEEEYLQKKDILKK